ncbi:MAG: hypothetical protein QW728_01365 [Thermoplasmata archaeon]
MEMSLSVVEDSEKLYIEYSRGSVWEVIVLSLIPFLLISGVLLITAPPSLISCGGLIAGPLITLIVIIVILGTRRYQVQASLMILPQKQASDYINKKENMAGSTIYVGKKKKYDAPTHVSKNGGVESRYSRFYPLDRFFNSKPRYLERLEQLAAKQLAAKGYGKDFGENDWMFISAVFRQGSLTPRKINTAFSVGDTVSARIIRKNDAEREAELVVKIKKASEHGACRDESHPSSTLQKDTVEKGCEITVASASGEKEKARLHKLMKKINSLSTEG